MTEKLKARILIYTNGAHKTARIHSTIHTCRLLYSLGYIYQ